MTTPSVELTTSPDNRFLECADDDVEVYSEGCELYINLRDGTQTRTRLKSRAIHMLCKLSTLFGRLLRLQFYNVIHHQGRLFISFAKEHFTYEIATGSLVKLPIPEHVRFFRGGVSLVDGMVYAGEYFGNPERHSVNIWRIPLAGQQPPSVAYSFLEGSIRHVHAVKYNSGEDRFYVLTGDLAPECSIMAFDRDFNEAVTVGSGDESYRAIVCEFFEDGFLYVTDAEHMQNRVYRVVDGERIEIGLVDGPVFYSLKTNAGVLLSSVYEGCPSQTGNSACLYLYTDSDRKLVKILTYEKDMHNTRYFQFGQIRLPVACRDSDCIPLQTSGLRVKRRVQKICFGSAAGTGAVAEGSDAMHFNV